MSRKRRKRSRQKIEIPKRYIQIFVVALCVFILGGGFYNMIETPPPIVPLPSGASSLHPYFNDQTSTEGYVVMMTNLFIFAGLWMIHKSSQVTYDRTSANRWLVAGIVAVFVGIAANNTIIQIKQGLL